MPTAEFDDRKKNAGHYSLSATEVRATPAVKEQAPRFTSLTRSLLHTRLIAGFGIVTLAFIVFMVRGLFLELPIALRLFHAGVTLSLGCSFLVVYYSRALRITVLRWLECAANSTVLFRRDDRQLFRL